MNDIVWPHVPRHRAEPKCDRCPRTAEPGSALCSGCADDQYDYDRDRAEEAAEREQRIREAWQ